MSDKQPASIARRFLSLCFALFAGAVLLVLALQLLSQIWGWLLLIAGVVALWCVGVAVWRYWWGRRF